MNGRPPASRSARVRRLLADLGRPVTRGDALRRIRRRLASTALDRLGLAHGDQAAGSTGVGRKPSWHATEWSRLAATVLGPADRAAQDDEGAPTDRARASDAVKAAGLQRAQAVLGAAIARGDPLERAVAHGVAALAEAIEWEAAWSLAEGAGRLPGGGAASAIGHGVLLHRRRQFARAWTVLRELDDAVLNAHIPIEGLDAVLGSIAIDEAAGEAGGGDGSDGTTDEARRRARAIGTPTAAMDAPTVVDLAGRLLAFGERERAADCLAELARRPPAELDALGIRRRHARDLIERWLEPRPIPVPAGAIPLAVLDYQSPDHVLTSGNLGDYIQTLSMVANVARLSDVTFTGEEGLGELATELQARVRPELRVPTAAGSIHLVGVDRDFSGSEAVPPGTWMIAFGWHMHPLFDLRYDFPYHPNIQPLFLSFHVNRLDMLSDAALAYLKEHGPIGCRDWNTVYLLLSAGVDAFFSGCLTTTIDAVYPARAGVYSGGGEVGLIDLPAHAAGPGTKRVRLYGHQADATAAMTLAEGLRAADTALAGYQRTLDRAITNRLHAYLPLTALGVPVDFRPGRPGDVRFAGLVGLKPDDAALNAIRHDIRELIGRAFERIVAGADATEVARLWREMTAAHVADARARFAAPPRDVSLTLDVADTVAETRAGSRRFGPHEAWDPAAGSNIVLAFDQNLLTPAAVLLESIVSHASDPLRVWILGRGLPDGYVEWLAEAFPSIALTVLPCDHITYGPKGRPHRIPLRITISTMDRLLLPDLLDDVDRIVYLDVDTLVLDDIGRLARIDLEGRPLAARDTNVTSTAGWQAALRPMPEPIATDFRRTIGYRHGFGSAALNAGVLVLDLARMRLDRFASSYLPLVEQYGLHDQDIMLAYAGPDRSVLDSRWNALPVLEDVRDPWIIHWAAFGKPWDRDLTFAQDAWHAYADRLRARAGEPPTGESSTSSGRP